MPPDLQNLDGQFLLVTQVTPEPDRTTRPFTNPDVPPCEKAEVLSSTTRLMVFMSAAVRAYYEHNETNTFSFSRQLDTVERVLIDTAPSISQYHEKTLLRCAESKCGLSPGG